MDAIENAIKGTFHNDLHVVRSTDNEEQLVLRIRVADQKSREKYGEGGEGVMGGEEDEGDPDEEEADDDFLKMLEQEILSKMDLGGMSSIRKAFMRNSKESVVNSKTGVYEQQTEWMLDTEGVNLPQVMAYEAVDFSRTFSNDVVEVFMVLGIEAARQLLMNEIGNVISFDGSYVNMRHLAILVDSMTYRGHLMAITRHGVNRVETGPLMKCSFEETTDMLLEGAVLGEKDELKGVTENIMMGQLAPIGTGSFTLLLNEEMLKQAIEPEESTSGVLLSTGESPRNTGLEGVRLMTPGRIDDRRAGRDLRATPGMAYSPTAWATPGRMASTRVPNSIIASPSVGNAQFSPTLGAQF